MLVLLVRLSPTENLLRDPNPKWISNKIHITSNRVSIWKNHFGCQERYNPNLSILSPGDPFIRRVLFWVLLLEKIKIGIEPFTSIKREMGLIFRVTVVGYGEKSICPNTGVSAITTENRHRHLSTAGSPHQPSTNHGKTRSIPVVLAKTYYYCRMSCLSVGLQGFF
jgi:hypothetical protein